MTAIEKPSKFDTKFDCLSGFNTLFDASSKIGTRTTNSLKKRTRPVWTDQIALSTQSQAEADLSQLDAEKKGSTMI